jgi:signal peptidase I
MEINKPDAGLKKNKNIAKVLLEWVVYILIFLVIVWGVPKALVYMLHTDYPIASITSGSMWPVLKQKDIVFIRGYTGNKADLKIGDIVVYRNEKGFTIHRIIELRDSTLVTQGDANNISDIPIGYDQLVGKMITLKGRPIRIPWLGNLSQMASHNPI